LIGISSLKPSASLKVARKIVDFSLKSPAGHRLLAIWAIFQALRSEGFFPIRPDLDLH
jgi:hypothetical protein